MADFENYSQGVDQLKQALSSLVLPLDVGEETGLIPPDIYECAQTVREFFKCMSPYFSYLSLDLLQLIVHLSGCKAAANRVEEFAATRADKRCLVLCYGEQKSLFSDSAGSLETIHNSSLEALHSTQPQVFAKLPEHQSVAIHGDMVRISARINNSVLCLSDYDSIVLALCSFFKIPKAALVCIGCSKTPLVLVWLVSDKTLKYIESSGGGISGERLLIQQGVLSLAVGSERRYTCLTNEVR